MFYFILFCMLGNHIYAFGELSIRTRAYHTIRCSVRCVSLFHVACDVLCGVQHVPEIRSNAEMVMANVKNA